MTASAEIEVEPMSVLDIDPVDAEPARTLGSEVKKTAHLAWPVILGQLAIVGMNLVDTILAGRISSQVLAEVAIGSALWGTALLWIIGTMMAVSPAISALRGKMQDDSCAESQLADTVTQALYLARLQPLHSY